jgi:hypothetical protein
MDARLNLYDNGQAGFLVPARIASMCPMAR